MRVSVGGWLWVRERDEGKERKERKSESLLVVVVVWCCLVLCVYVCVRGGR